MTDTPHTRGLEAAAKALSALDPYAPDFDDMPAATQALHRRNAEVVVLAYHCAGYPTVSFPRNAAVCTGCGGVVVGDFRMCSACRDKAVAFAREFGDGISAGYREARAPGAVLFETTAAALRLSPARLPGDATGDA